MNAEFLNTKSERRSFLSRVTAGIAGFGLATLTAPFTANAAQQKPMANKKTVAATNEADAWFTKVKGQHRVVYDATHPHEIMPFVWPKVFLLTNEATGSPASDCGVVVVLRHEAICYAFNDSMWSKYNFNDLFKAGELGGAFQAADASTATKTRNPFLNTKPGDFKVPGFGAVEIGIPELQKDGVLFCVCNAAMTVYSNVAAMQMNLKAEEVMNDWKSNLVSGIQVVPSGVWALGRAQEHGCSYIFAG